MQAEPTDPTLDYYAGQQPTPATQPTSGSGWLPPGATLNPDGSVTMPGGNVIAAPPAGYQRDPNTGAIVPIAGSTDNPNQGALPAYQQQATPSPTGNQSVTGGGDPGQMNSGQGLFDPSLYTPFKGTPPTYTPGQLPPAPTWKTPPAFSYKPFEAPTLDEAANQPGYAFGVQQGEKALQQSRAAQGLLRTGGTLKDILDYGRNAATQNYGNVLNQDLGIYNMNRAGAVQEYNTNYQTQYVDPYQAQILPWQTEAASNQHNADTGYNNAWNQYLNSQDLWFNNQNSSFGKYLSLAQLGAANA